MQLVGYTRAVLEFFASFCFSLLLYCFLSFASLFALN